MEYVIIFSSMFLCITYLINVKYFISAQTRYIVLLTMYVVRTRYNTVSKFISISVYTFI